MLNSINNLKWGPATVLVVVIVSAVCIGGLVVVIVDPTTLTFHQYLSELQGFALAVAGLAVGRGLHLGLTGTPPSLLDAGGDSVTAGEEAGVADDLLPDPDARTARDASGERVLAQPAEPAADEPLAGGSGVPQQ